MGSAQIYLEALVKIMFGLFEVLSRYMFRFIYGSSGKKMPPIKDLLLLESATSLAYKIRTRKVTSVQVTQSFINRIKEINPVLNCAVADRYEEALQEAKEADELVSRDDITPEELIKSKPLLGVPFTTKDCIAIKGMIQSSGLYARRNVIAEKDAKVVENLRAAGAIPIALTNVSELCMWWESSNKVHGRTNNPYDTNRIVGGSSGGEGCIQASAGSAFGIGSDIGGSIRMPAFFNGVFGHKPSKFIVSNDGQYPIPVTREHESFLGIGPICRRAEDLLPLLKIFAGTNASLLNLDEPVDLKKLRFFYQETDGGSILVSPVNAEIKDLFKKIEIHMNKAHKIQVQQVHLKSFSKSRNMWMFNMRSPRGKFDEQLSNMKGAINIPLEFLKWLFGYSAHTFIALCTALLEKLGPQHGSEGYTQWVEERNKFRLELMDLLGDNGVLLYPTHPTSAPYHNEPLLKPFNFAYTGIINVLTLPATHIPMGVDKNGLPIGVQVIANDKCDRLCIAVAKELEKAFGGWVPPLIEA